MMEILQFIFGSFWRWLGATMIITIVFSSIGYGLSGFRLFTITHKDK